jgi:hypothetical protein
MFWYTPYHRGFLNDCQKLVRKCRLLYYTKTADGFMNQLKSVFKRDRRVDRELLTALRHSLGYHQDNDCEL